MSIQRASLIVAFLLSTVALPLKHAQAASSALGSTICVRAAVSGVSGSGLIYDSDGVLVATGTPGTSVIIICTLFRDNTTNTNGMQDLELSVFVDPLAGGTIFCDALSMDRKGLIKKAIRRQTTGTGELVLDWGGSVNASVNKGFYAMRCQVPEGAKIHSVFYLEP